MNELKPIEMPEILTTQDAIDRLNMIIRVLRKHNRDDVIAAELDPVRQFLGKQL